MTINNQVKAPRPCKLPKGWVDADNNPINVINANEIATVEFRCWMPNTRRVAITTYKEDEKFNFQIVNKVIAMSPEVFYDYDHPIDAKKELVQYSDEAIQAIATAQRPWLASQAEQEGRSE